MYIEIEGNVAFSFGDGVDGNEYVERNGRVQRSSPEKVSGNFHNRRFSKRFDP